MLLVVFSQGMNNGCGDVALRRLKWIYTRIGLSLGANSSSVLGSHPTLCYVAPTVLARTPQFSILHFEFIISPNFHHGDSGSTEIDMFVTECFNLWHRLQILTDHLS